MFSKRENILKFIGRFLLFFLFNLVVMSLIFYVREYDSSTIIGKQVGYTVQKSKLKNDKVKKVLIGDSVASQIYNPKNYNDTLLSLTSVQAISMVGQYLILKEFLDNNTQEDLSVSLIYHPVSFKNDLKSDRAFNYFLKPFYNDENKSEFSENVWKQVKEIPYYWLSKIPLIKNSTWSPGVKMDPNLVGKFQFAEISIEYLTKIDSLCKQRNIIFEVLPPFLSEKYTDEQFPELKRQIAGNDLLKDLFKNYFTQIKYIPDNFFADDLHLKKKDKKMLGYNYLEI